MLRSTDQLSSLCEPSGEIAIHNDHHKISIEHEQLCQFFRPGQKNTAPVYDGQCLIRFISAESAIGNRRQSALLYFHFYVVVVAVTTQRVGRTDPEGNMRMVSLIARILQEKIESERS